MNKYKGILISKKILKENDLIIKILSNSDKIISGIVYGGLSKKKRTIYQIGYFLNFEVLEKNNRPLSINAEIIPPHISLIINDKYKLNCLLCVTSIINLAIIEGQHVNDIYFIVENFLNKMFVKKKWLIDFHKFLFDLLKVIGYEIKYTNNDHNIYFDLNKLEFVKVKSNYSVKFPFHLFKEDYSDIDKTSVNNIFKIFELVFVKFHLSNINIQLPNHYQLFKKQIIDKI